MPLSPHISLKGGPSKVAPLIRVVGSGSKAMSKSLGKEVQPLGASSSGYKKYNKKKPPIRRASHKPHGVPSQNAVVSAFLSKNNKSI